MHLRYFTKCIRFYVLRYMCTWTTVATCTSYADKMWKKCLVPKDHCLALNIYIDKSIIYEKHDLFCNDTMRNPISGKIVVKLLLLKSLLQVPVIVSNINSEWINVHFLPCISGARNT